MSSPARELEHAVAAFRREQALGYLTLLAGQPRDPRLEGRARRALTAERMLSLLDDARSDGAHDAPTHAAICAHMGRAVLEQALARARDATSGLLMREVSVEGETRALGQLLEQLLGARAPAVREKLLGDMEPALGAFARELIARRADADAEVARLFARLAPPRHPDAGPEGGAQAIAQAWLSQTADLTREALAFARRTLSLSGQSGLDTLLAALGQPLSGLVPRDGRLRRLSSDWEPLGLRRMLASRARAAPVHPGPWPAPHVLVLSAPNDVRVSPAARELGLASELASAEAVGRAVGIVHASEALPLPLRFAPVASTARAVGGLAVQRFLSPHFLRRVRGFSERESNAVARLSALWFLVDSRLAAASVLGRGSRGPAALDPLGALGEQALLGPIPPGAAATLILRASPGGAFRAKVHAPALSWALRERYDEDWYLNPRASEPLRGALARAGTFSVEAFAEEQGTTIERGIDRLTELF